MATMGRAPTHGTLGVRRKVEKVLAAAEAAKITLPGTDQALEALERAGRLQATMAEPVQMRRSRGDELARSLARGEVEVLDVLRECAQLDAMGNPDNIAFRVIREGVRLAEVVAWESLRDPSEAVFDGLKPAADEVVAEIRKLRKTIPPEVTDAASALKHGPQVAAAWSKYVSLKERWDSLHKLVNWLRGSGLLPVPELHQVALGRLPGHVPATLEPERWAGLLAREDHKSSREFVRILLDVVCDEWEPGIFTADEIDAHIQVAEREARADKAAV